MILGALLFQKVDEAARQDLESRIRLQATVVAQLSSNVLSGSLDDGDATFTESLRVLGATTHTRYSLITAEGVVVAEPMAEAPDEVPPLNQPEITLAKREGVGIAERDGILYVAATIAPDGVLIGYARASVPASRVAPEFEELQMRVAFGGLLAVFASVLLGWLVAGRLVRSVASLSPVIAPVRGGDAARPLPLTDGSTLTETAGPTAESAHPAMRKTAVESSACSVGYVVAEVESLTRAGAIEKGLSLLIGLDTPIPKSVTTDASALRQILTSLVQNAIKFTDAGTVSIQVGFDPEAPLARRLRLTVSDTGLGMAAEQLTQVFEPRGTAICLDALRRSTRLLGGELEASSRAGVGSAFTVLLPTGIRSHEMCSELASLHDAARADDAPVDALASLGVETPLSSEVVPIAVGHSTTDRSPSLDAAG